MGSTGGDPIQCWKVARDKAWLHAWLIHTCHLAHLLPSERAVHILSSHGRSGVKLAGCLSPFDFGENLPEGQRHMQTSSAILMIRRLAAAPYMKRAWASIRKYEDADFQVGTSGKSETAGPGLFNSVIPLASKDWGCLGPDSCSITCLGPDSCSISCPLIMLRALSQSIRRAAAS